MSTLSEAVARARTLGYCVALLHVPQVAYAVRCLHRVEETKARVRKLCAILGIDPEPVITNAAGDPAVLEDAADRIARTGSRPSLAAELADA